MNSDDCMEWPEFYVDPNTGYSHIIHRSLKERVEDLEKEVEALRNQLSLILHLDPLEAKDE